MNMMVWTTVSLHHNLVSRFEERIVFFFSKFVYIYIYMIPV